MSIFSLFKSTFLLSSLIVFWDYSQPILKVFNHPINPPNNVLATQNSTPVAAELQEILPQIREQTQVPILLPTQLLITGTDRKIYVEGKGTSNGYENYFSF